MGKTVKKLVIGLTLSAVLVGGVSVTTPQKAEAAWWSTVLIKIINYAGNSWYDRTPSKTEDVNSVTISSGDIAFNNLNSSGYGASAKMNLSTEDTGEIDAWAQTGILNWPGAISIIITTSWGSDVVSKTVTHNQHVLYKPGYQGDFTVRWVQNSKQAWDVWLRYWKGYNYPTIAGTPPSHAGEFELQKVNGKKVKAVEVNGGIHLIPSDSHTKGNKNANHATVTMAGLHDQIFDRQLNENVDDLRDYSAGDTLHFKDIIQATRYNASQNATFFAFSDGKDGVVEWPFAGDLTDKFKAGSELALQFKVVTNDGRFESLDYIKYGYEHSGAAPAIEKYLY